MQPHPKFAWCDDPNEQHYDPLTDLALELAEGEFVNYTVREVIALCTVTVEGIGAGDAEISCNGKVLGKFTFKAGNILTPAKTGAFTIDAAEEAIVKIRVLSGTITVKNVIFKY